MRGIVNQGIHGYLEQQKEARNAATGLELALAQENATTPVFAQFVNAVTVGKTNLAASIWNEIGGDNKAWPFITTKDAKQSFATPAAALKTLQRVQDYLTFWAQRQLQDEERIAEWFATNLEQPRDELGRFAAAQRISVPQPHVTGAPQRVSVPRVFRGLYYL